MRQACSIPGTDVHSGVNAAGAWLVGAGVNYLLLALEAKGLPAPHALEADDRLGAPGGAGCPQTSPRDPDTRPAPSGGAAPAHAR